jgi:hypothetical protein
MPRARKALGQGSGSGGSALFEWLLWRIAALACDALAAHANWTLARTSVPSQRLPSWPTKPTNSFTVFTQGR